ncbi:MAG: hypothetical protein ACOVO2_02435 [Emticicia sp.]|uniref:hypothetical protein n=1 Tax=Emticicia sp. TaxID=1930953 RepID=UPI003BA52E17
MNIKNLKPIQYVFGSIMLVLFGFYLYMTLFKEQRGEYYELIKGVFHLSLALTFHFGMLQTKATTPEKYNPTLHKILVATWGLVGVIGIIDFIANYI